ncbi:hypothetical protein C8R43DRAFT_252680 [Mycena crocata]|nr:hypothetical protein C8R43DRAFT_252680 [Mycena crocata]
MSRPKLYTVLHSKDFEYALPSLLDPSLPIRATVREIHHDPAAPRLIYSPTFIQIGRPLIHAESFHELCMALVDALLGWLSLHQSGFVHRDISIANVLLTDSEHVSHRSKMLSGARIYPVQKNNNTDPQESSGHPGSVSPAQISDEISALIAKLPNDHERKYAAAFVVDGDMALDWRTKTTNICTPLARSVVSPGFVHVYLAELRLKGTPEFMSLDLHEALHDSSPSYLHSPIDDIESFFWLALWAALFNTNINSSQDPTEVEKAWRRDLGGADFLLKLAISRKLRKMDLDSDDFALKHSAILGRLLPLLQKWWIRQEALAEKWRATVKTVKKNEECRRSQFYSYHFRIFALQGVRDFLRLVVDEIDELEAHA